MEDLQYEEPKEGVAGTKGVECPGAVGESGIPELPDIEVNRIQKLVDYAYDKNNRDKRCVILYKDRGGLGEKVLNTFSSIILPCIEPTEMVAGKKFRVVDTNNIITILDHNNMSDKSEIVASEFNAIAVVKPLDFSTESLREVISRIIGSEGIFVERFEIDRPDHFMYPHKDADYDPVCSLWERIRILFSGGSRETVELYESYRTCVKDNVILMDRIGGIERGWRAVVSQLNSVIDGLVSDLSLSKEKIGAQSKDLDDTRQKLRDETASVKKYADDLLQQNKNYLDLQNVCDGIQDELDESNKALLDSKREASQAKRRRTIAEKKVADLQKKIELFENHKDLIDDASEPEFTKFGLIEKVNAANEQLEKSNKSLSDANEEIKRLKSKLNDALAEIEGYKSLVHDDIPY